MSAKLTSQRRISPHEGQEGGSIGSASAAASFGWRNGSASPDEGVDSCRQRSQIGNPGFNICASQPPVPQVPFPKIPIATLRRHFGESLQTVCRYAAPRNITILLEPLNLYEALPGVLTSVYDAIGLIDELGVDNLGVQPDVFHMNISESSMTSALRAAGKRIRVFHMNETNHYRLGTGHADYKAIIRTLKDCGFDGYVTVYAPLISEDVFHKKGQSPERPDLKTALGEQLRFLKEIESIVDAERIIYGAGAGT